jgi:hypothetical protein
VSSNNIKVTGSDPVNNPTHYNSGKLECIEAMEAMLSPEEFIGYLRGNSFKYRWRFRYKNGIEDLRKANWYEQRLIDYIVGTGYEF